MFRTVSERGHSSRGLNDTGVYLGAPHLASEMWDGTAFAQRTARLWTKIYPRIIAASSAVHFARDSTAP